MKSLLQAYVDTVYAIDAVLDLHPACPLPERTMPIPPVATEVKPAERIQQELEAMNQALHEAEAVAAKYLPRRAA